MYKLALLFAHMVSTLLMIGIIWFVRVMRYPLMVCVGAEHCGRYAQLHQSPTTLVIAGPILVEELSAIGLFAWFPLLRLSPAFLAAGVLLGMIWASTTWWQVPLDQTLARGYDERHIRRLVQTNSLRMPAWSLRGFLIGGIFWSTMAGAA